MKKYTRFFYLFGFCLVYSFLNAQEWGYDFISFNTDDGLPHRNVTNIYTDQDDILWLVTNFSLSRYDGQTMKVYDQEQLGEVADNIYRIAQDPVGNLWLWGKNGCHVFDPYAAELRYKNNASASYPLFPIEDFRGQLLFNLGDSPVVHAYGGDSLGQHVQLPFARPFNLLGNYQDEKIWARSDTTLLLLNSDWSPTLQLPVEGFGKVDQAFITADGSLLVFFEHKIEGNPPSIIIATPDGRILDAGEEWGISLPRKVFFEEGEQHLWLGYEDHWEVRDLSGHLLVEIKTDNDLLYHLSASWEQTNDQNGYLWICTESGFVRLTSERKRFESFLHKAQNPNGNRYSIRGIWANKDTIIAGAELNGIIFKDHDMPPVVLEATAEYHNYLAGRGLREQFNYRLAADFRGVFRDAEGQFWFGQKRSVLRWDASNNSVKTFPPAFEYDVEFGINPWCFAKTADGTLLVGAQPGLKVIWPEQDSLYQLEFSGDFAALNEAAIYRIIKNDDGYWLATSKGLFLLGDQLNPIARYSSAGEGRFTLRYDDLYDVEPAAEGQFWLATHGDGLVLFDPGSGVRRHWTKKEGLIDNVLYAARVDRFGYLWLPSDYGLMRLDTQDTYVQVFLEGQGLPHHEFNRGAHFQRADEKLLFGTLNGLVCFDPADFIEMDFPRSPPLVVNSLLVRPKGQKHNINLTRSLLLDSMIYLQNDLEFAQLSVALPAYEKIDPIFEYRIDEGDWQVMNGNMLQLGKYDYGTHRLAVRGRIAGSKFADKSLELTIEVEEPIYLRLYFMVLVLFIFAAISYIISRYRVKRLLRRQTQLKERINAATAQLEQDRNLIQQQATELAKIDELKTRFFANISHELRTPLTLIMAPLRAFAQRGDLSPQDKKFVQLADNNAQELLRSVNSILDLAKLDAQGIQLEEKTIALGPWLNSIVDRFQPKATRQKVDLLLLLPCPRPGSKRFDHRKVETILSNLLSNALRFTSVGGRITLELIQSQSDHLQFQVSDTGQGIPQEDLPFIFDRFYQSTHTDHQTGGTGIGLALCAEFANLLRGELTVTSEINNGSVFTLNIPVKNGDLPQVDEETDVATHSINAETERPPAIQPPNASSILIVEDNADMRLFLSMILAEDYLVIQAENGIEAQQKLMDGEFTPDLIITDLMMPNLDGFELIKWIKAEERLRTLPLIVLTARSAVEDKIQVLRYGVDDYVAKPFDPDELLVRVDRLLSNYLIRQAESQNNQAEAMSENPSEWLSAIEAFVIEHVEDDRLSATFLAHEFHLSVRQLQRNLKVASGQTPAAYIREIRLNEAMRLLVSGGAYSVKATAAAVGFKKVEYFSLLFKKRFGRSPSSFLKMSG